jgi:glycosyltransferase involved in cell wall biosynthesis
MAMGKALIASDVGGHKELIKHEQTGFLFPAGDVLALADSLGRLLKDDILREKIENEGYTWALENHTWDKTTSVYTEMYAEALGKYQGASHKNLVTRN